MTVESKKSSLDFLNLPLWPDFDFGDEAIDGLVPSCRIESWTAFEKLLSESGHDVGGEMIYRGQRRHEWQLAATLTRQFDGGAIRDDVSGKLLRKFSLAMRGRGFDLQDHTDNEVWAFGQHYGLATPLLDWTESPFVALFFAFADEDSPSEKENPSRAIFRLNMAALSELMPELFFEPALGENARLVNQAGLFTVTPSNGDNLVSAIVNAVAESGAANADNAKEMANYICKIHVPNKDRVACLSVLRKMNIHHANLFPDPTGASRYCNDWLDRIIAQQAREQEAKARLSEQNIAEKISADRASPEEKPTVDVESILRNFIVESDGVTDAQLNDWASRIDNRYSNIESLDWPKHPSARSKIHVEIKRLLAALEFPKDRRDLATDALVAYFAKSYMAEHGLLPTDPNNGAYDFFKAAR